MSGVHVALIVEDDPQVADVLEELVASLGHAFRHATTLEEVRAAVAAGGYCYVLLDMQIPADATSREAVGCGETALRLVRRASSARNAADHHVLPVIVVTGYSRDPDFVSKMHKNGADDFIPKPFGDRPDRILDTIRAALELAGREEHGACDAARGEQAVSSKVSAVVEEAPPGTASGSAAAEPVRVAIEGTWLAQRNDLLVNGTRATLPDAHFTVFLSAVLAHQRARGEWESAAKLGMTRNQWAPSRIQSELKGLLPAGFRVLEANKPHAFRLNPAIVIERVEWGALGKHPQATVRKIAAEGGKLEGQLSTRR